MRVGVVWNANARLTGITVRFERYLRGLRALGHDAFAVCTREAAQGFEEPTLAASSLADFVSPAYWRSLDLDAAFVITWLGMPDVLRALKGACPWVVSLADSDGQVGTRAHPGSTFRRMVRGQLHWRAKLGAAKFWAELYYEGPRAVQHVIESASLADLVVFGADLPKMHFEHFLAKSGRLDLKRKLSVVLYPVDDCFLDADVRTDREDAVVAIGRWDDPQKDAGLLSSGIARYLARGARTSFYVFGRGGERWFVPLSRQYPQVRYLGVQPPLVIAERLGRSRILLFSSMWEGSPVSANEALASGCTLVAPSYVPSLRSFCEAGAGTCFRGRRAERLASAIETETRAWARGERVPSAIASVWRPQVDPVAVARALLPVSERGGGQRAHGLARESGSCKSPAA